MKWIVHFLDRATGEAEHVLVEASEEGDKLLQKALKKGSKDMLHVLGKEFDMFIPMDRVKCLVRLTKADSKPPVAVTAPASLSA